MSQIAEKYAKALLLSAKGAESVYSAKSDFGLFIKTIKANINLEFTLMNLSLNYELEKRIISGIFKDKLSPTFIKFIDVILKRKREKYLFEIYEKFNELSDEALGIIKIELFTADPINDDQENLIKKMLSHKLGKKVVIEKKISPSLIGGGILKIKDKIVDFSIKNNLETLRKELMLC